LDQAALQAMLQQVPATRVHDSLDAFADFLLQRGQVPDSAAGGLD
jgi:hypothetical protein